MSKHRKPIIPDFSPRKKPSPGVPPANVPAPKIPAAVQRAKPQATSSKSGRRGT